MSFSTITTELPLSAFCITKLQFIDRVLSASNSSLESYCGILTLQLEKDVKTVSLILDFMKSNLSPDRIFWLSMLL